MKQNNTRKITIPVLIMSINTLNFLRKDKNFQTKSINFQTASIQSMIFLGMPCKIGHRKEER